MLNKVGIGITKPIYNNEPPFHPDTHYPELPFSDVSSMPNHPYRLLRELFVKLGLDIKNYGGLQWNPLGTIIKPGQTVLLKPNFVLSFNSSGDDLFAVVTHPSILRAIVDYVYLALKGIGRIVIADAPQMDCNWEELMASQHLNTIQTFYRSKLNFNIEVYDLRNFALIDRMNLAYTKNRKNLPGDPLGSIIINLGCKSAFYGLPSENYYGADFNRSETIMHHQGETHEYCISKTVLSADVFISVPKMKVHKKVGVTLNFKGLVGINTNKNYLIHYRIGTIREGGDQLPDQLPKADRVIVKIKRFLYDKALAKKTKWGELVYKVASSFYKYFVKPVKKISQSTVLQDGGNWYGNDSAWRMTSDLAKILLFADAEGKLHELPQRKILCVIDGIIGGENNGPLSPNSKLSGVLIAGENPLSVDLVATRLMGFDYQKIKIFKILNSLKGFDFGIDSIDQINVLSDDKEIQQMFMSKSRFFDYKPHPGWVGHLEI